MTNTARRRPVFAGFTLIELLVVIAIISILAAILFPVFATVRKRAQYTACLSNLRELGIAVRMYTDDNDSTYFYNLGPRFAPSVIADITPGSHIDPADPNSNRWDAGPVMPVLDGYIKDSKLWRCPALPVPFVDSAKNYCESSGLTNYQVNAYIAVNTFAGAPHKGPVQENDIVAPTRVKVIEDFWNQGVGVHFDGANYACADGHAKFQRSLGGFKGFITSKWWAVPQ